MNDILGAVLAGGSSRRFGSDKALALLDGVTLLDHAIAGIGRFTDEVVVCGREVDGRMCIPDRPAPGLGPLGGLNAALWRAREKGYRGVLTTGCDTPFFPDRLDRMLADDGPAVAKHHHLIGYWPVALAEALDAHLQGATDRSVKGWISIARARHVAIPGTLPNINTEADLQQLRDGA